MVGKMGGFGLFGVVFKGRLNKGSTPSYHNNRVNHQHQKPFLITLSNGDWIRR
ncbi:hypothetical protein BSPWISOXPB_3642 [uncultured Gammaproteobacteria bacterium]|nr:hypothetical protein BSPWISOXPB_3642 [uncultured Gammaproteobacteria bacterium]